jgi:ligand-binding sensor domain-containing protein
MRGHQVLPWMIFSLITPPLLFAQTEQLRFENFSAEHGLSQTYIPAIIQDRRGFMWFATRAGLLRYDGNHIKVYLHAPGDSSSLTDSDITRLYEDRQGTLWVGTYNGLNRYDHTRDIFKQYNWDRYDTTKLGYHVIGAIYEDTQGRLWIGTGFPSPFLGGLHLMNRQTGVFKRYQSHPEKPNGISSNALLAIAEDARGNLWIAHWEDGLDCFDPRSERFTHYKSNKNDINALPTNIFHCAQRDDKGTLWFGGEYSGLIKLVLPDGHRDNRMSFKHYTHKNYATPASLCCSTL